MIFMNKEMSPIAAGILAGLEEALEDAKRNDVPGIRKTTVYETVSTETASFTDRLSSFVPAAF
jgi:hypothetical protein